MEFVEASQVSGRRCSGHRTHHPLHLDPPRLEPPCFLLFASCFAPLLPQTVDPTHNDPAHLTPLATSARSSSRPVPRSSPSPPFPGLPSPSRSSLRYSPTSSSGMPRVYPLSRRARRRSGEQTRLGGSIQQTRRFWCLGHLARGGGRWSEGRLPATPGVCRVEWSRVEESGLDRWRI